MENISFESVDHVQVRVYFVDVKNIDRSFECLIGKLELSDNILNN